MKEIIDDLKDLSGVIGVCLYHGQSGVLTSNLPAIFSPEKLTDIGKLLMRIQSAGRMTFNDLTDLSLHYDESVILVRELEENLVVFLLCDPDFNQNLVTMSLNLAQQELQNQQTPLVQQFVKEDKPPEAAATVEQIEPILAQIKEPLPKILGPMADFVFEEAVESWQATGNATLNNLGGLVQLLENEIGNADQIKRFHDKIAHVMIQAAKGR